jgi:hypothetical protein
MLRSRESMQLRRTTLFEITGLDNECKRAMLQRHKYLA